MRLLWPKQGGKLVHISILKGHCTDSNTGGQFTPHDKFLHLIIMNKQLNVSNVSRILQVTTVKCYLRVLYWFYCSRLVIKWVYFHHCAPFTLPGVLCGVCGPTIWQEAKRNMKFAIDYQYVMKLFEPFVCHFYASANPHHLVPDLYWTMCLPCASDK